MWQEETDSWLENAANGLMGKQVSEKSQLLLRSTNFDGSTCFVLVLVIPYGVSLVDQFTLHFFLNAMIIDCQGKRTNKVCG